MLFSVEKRLLRLLLTVAATVLLAACGQESGTNAELLTVDEAAAQEVVVYSSRKEHLIKPLFDMYEEKTGVKVSYITDKAAPLIARIKAEGASTPADMLITVDAGNLWQAQQEGILSPLQSEPLLDMVPSHLRAQDNSWFGLSVRARTMVYSTDRVQSAELSTYEALAADSWRGRLCLRTSKKVYNQSLVATMMERLGEVEAEKVVSGWVANLATDPFSNDTKTMEAILAGQCDVSIVNTYYFGRLKSKQPELALALFWPNQQDRGVHVNISGAGVTKHAKHPAAAQKLLEWLATAEAQAQFAGLNQEFPVNPNVPASAEVQSWGGFKADDINVEVAGRRQADAIMLMDRAGYR